jgi:MFS transporter, DHA1 family, staphyloferrin A biosynthesis exporter
MGMFFAFRYPAFRWLWIGSTFSSCAQWIQTTTLAWVAFEITGSVALLGAIIAASAVAQPAVSPLAGLAADRFKRSHVVAVSQFLLFVNAAALAAALLLDAVHVWHLFAFAISASVLNGFNTPARASMVFDVVPREVGPNAVALSSVAGNVMRMLGPAIGGAMIVSLGPANNFLAQAVAYLLVMVTVLQVRVPSRPPGAARQSTFIRDLVGGYRWVLSNPQGRIMFLMMMIYPLFVIPVHNSLMVIFARDVFAGGAAGLGLMYSAVGVGGMVGGFLTAALNRVDHRGMMQLYALWTLGGFLALFAIVGGLTGQLWLGLVLLVISGIGGSVFHSANTTVIQLLAPNHLRGRISSVMQVERLGVAVGTLLAGAAAEIFGAVAMATVNGLLVFGAGVLVFACSPWVRGLRLSAIADPSDEEADGDQATASPPVR